VVATLSSNKKKYSNLKLLFLFWIFVSKVLANNNISFDLEKANIKSAFNLLINDYNLIIIYPDQISELIFSGKCNECTEEEAITTILKNTNLSWKKINKQFVIFFPKLKNKFSIYGRVFDKNSGQPIPYANIYIQKYDKGDISNHDGLFSISKIGSSPCSLKVSYIGYETINIPLSISHKKNTFHNISLTPKIIHSKEISIIGNIKDFMDQSNNPGQISFSPRHVSSLPNLGEVDIFRSIQFLPGIQLSLGSTSNLYVRGGKSDHNLITLDGMTLYQTSHMFGFISGISHEIIKDVQIFKGHIPAKYGGRVSSIIELSSRSGNNNSLHGSVYGNLMSNGILAEIPIFNKGNLVFNYRESKPANQFSKVYESIQKFMTGDNKFNLINATAKQDTNQSISYDLSSSYQDFFSRLSYLFNSKNRLTITTVNGEDSVFEGRNFFGFSNILEIDSTNINEMGKIKYKGVVVNLFSDWNIKYNSHLSVSQYLYSNQYSSKQSSLFNNNSIIIGSAIKEHLFYDNSIRFNHQYRGIEDHTVTMGFEETFYKINFKDENIDGNFSNTKSIKQYKHLFSFFLQDLWKPKRGLEIHTGFRISHINKIGKFYNEPRIAIKYKYNKTLSFETAFTQNSQFIHKYATENNIRINNNKWLISSPNIPITISKNYHSGINWDIKDYNFTYSIYLKNLNNYFLFNQSLAPQDYLSSSINFIDPGSGKSRGIELLLRKKTGKINGWVTYHHNQTKYFTPNYNNNKEYLADHDKTHEFKSVIIANFLKLNFSASWVFSSGRPFTQINNLYIESGSGYEIFTKENYNSKRIKNSHHLDISITKSLYISQVTMDIGFSIYNLYNRKNITHKRYNPYTGTLSISDVVMFGITPSIYTKISF
tara:strand:+ start:1369 stop:4008 length:2640 start_codon:yes stop_codon:yes gene_type:complete